MSPKSFTYDPDAYSFITASGISGTNATAINQLVLDLKSANIWSKFKAIYPIVGGSASSHKWNLKNPLDTNGAFRLSFSTGWTHSSTGMLPNGTSAFADTFLVTNTAFASDHNKHLSFYCQNDVSTGGNSSSIGSDNASAGWCRFNVKSIGNTGIVFGGTNGVRSVANTNAKGFYIANRPNSTTSEMYKNGSLFFNGNTNLGSTSQITQTLLIGAARSGLSVVYYDNKQCAFASIGDSLTAGEVTSFNTAVATFQTTLGRNV
jgi:hypothetical protein